MRAVLLVLAPLLVIAAPPAADACQPAYYPEHVTDAAHAPDVTAPSAVTAVYISTIASESESDGCAKTDCGGPGGYITLQLDATDDVTPRDMLGFGIQVIGGTTPPGFLPPSGPIRTEYGDELVLYFYGDPRESGFSMELEIRAIDLNGNLGPPVVLTVAAPGESGGCATGRSHTPPALAITFALLLLAVIVRRRMKHALSIFRHLVRHGRTIVSIIVAIVIADVRPASACSLVGNTMHELDAAHASDATAPSAATASALVIRSYEPDGCGAGASSCGDLAMIDLEVAATDNASPAERIGYQIRVVGGDAPDRLNLPATPITGGGGNLYLYFNAQDRSAFAVDLEIRAIDLNGNLGPPTIVTVSDPGDESGGCSSSHAPASSALLLLALVAIVRRRR